SQIGQGDLAVHDAKIGGGGDAGLIVAELCCSHERPLFCQRSVDLPLELVIENDAIYGSSEAANLGSFGLVHSVNLDVVTDLPRLDQVAPDELLRVQIGKFTVTYNRLHAALSKSHNGN